eukprot:COSAG06_NODE_934_length_11440_cov_5.939335_9_plen_65_part_00
MLTHSTTNLGQAYLIYIIERSRAVWLTRTDCLENAPANLAPCRTSFCCRRHPREIKDRLDRFRP